MTTINAETMSAITAERERITQRLARAQANVTAFSMELQELDAAERMLSRFSKGRGPQGQKGTRGLTPPTVPMPGTIDIPGPKRGRGRPPLAGTDADAPKDKRWRGASSSSSLHNITLQAVRDNPGQTGAWITAYINQHQKTPARPNHVGAALARHAKFGRLSLSGDKKTGTWYEPMAMPRALAS